MSRFSKYVAPAVVFCFATLLMGLSIVVQMRQVYGARIVSLQDLEHAPVAVVLGASVKRDGTPSDALQDRVQTAIRLYKMGKVGKLLMTGDDGGFHVNEVATMKRMALEAGAPEQDVIVDGHGYRTYESCKRAVEVFGIKEAILVTQRFHLYRALYLCTQLGMNEVQGISADLQTYERILFFTLRDWVASLKAWSDINLFPPSPPVKY